MAADRHQNHGGKGNGLERIRLGSRASEQAVPQHGHEMPRLLAALAENREFRGCVPARARASQSRVSISRRLTASLVASDALVLQDHDHDSAVLGLPLC